MGFQGFRDLGKERSSNFAICHLYRMNGIIKLYSIDLIIYIYIYILYYIHEYGMSGPTDDAYGLRAEPREL